MRNISMRLGLLVVLIVGSLTLAPAAWGVSCCFQDGTCGNIPDPCESVGGTPRVGSPMCEACPKPEGAACGGITPCQPGLQCSEGTCVRVAMAPLVSTAGLLFVAAALTIGGAFAVRRR